MGVQTSFSDLGTPLAEATLVIVDLETTGGSPNAAEITEIGAVKTRGGEVLAEFQTLVNPGTPIPPLIAALTGITDAAVDGAPGVASAVASFLQFSAGAVLVAHNAPYDTGFLRGACALHDLTWPRPAVLDTARIARAALLRDEVPNYRLATLAVHARAGTQPCHRALADARATVDVLHYLIERVGDLGVTTVEELAALTTRVSPAQRRKRSLADGLPNTPGVYQFLDDRGEPLYIGASLHVRDRVRSYFTATEKRSRMAEMVGLTARITAIECATGLQAAVRESRLLAAHKPPYNRRSRFPEKQAWVRLTAEPFPRLSAVQRPALDADGIGRHLGPFSSRRTAAQVIDALQLAFPIRSCTQRLPLHPVGHACLAADLGHCLAPCDGRIGRAEYNLMIDRVAAAFAADCAELARQMLAEAHRHARGGEYERATKWRDALQTIAEAVVATHRHAMLTGCRELVAARPTPAAGWEIHVIRRGRLAAAGVSARGADPRAAVERLRTGAEVIGEAPAANLTELSHLQHWLSGAGVRLVVAEPALSMPNTAAHEVARRLRAARDNLGPGVIDLRGTERGPGRARTADRVSRIALPAGSAQRL